MELKENENEYENGLPDVVKEEPDDAPAGKGILWVITIAVLILAILYFLFEEYLQF